MKLRRLSSSFPTSLGKLNLKPEQPLFSGDLASAVSVLQLFCSSPKPAMRFAAVRTLNKISINYPQAVISCNVDLEQLITDQNRSIATLAITTLLKTGAEASVERLMKQISSFVSEISDEFKVNNRFVNKNCARLLSSKLFDLCACVTRANTLQ